MISWLECDWLQIESPPGNSPSCRSNSLFHLPFAEYSSLTITRILNRSRASRVLVAPANASAPLLRPLRPARCSLTDSRLQPHQQRPTATDLSIEDTPHSLCPHHPIETRLTTPCERRWPRLPAKSTTRFRTNSILPTTATTTPPKLPARHRTPHQLTLPPHRHTPQTIRADESIRVPLRRRLTTVVEPLITIAPPPRTAVRKTSPHVLPNTSDPQPHPVPTSLATTFTPLSHQTSRAGSEQ